MAATALPQRLYSIKSCSVDGCGRARFQAEYCKLHLPKPPPQMCTAKGCGNKAKARTHKLCDKHLSRMERHGTLDIAHPRGLTPQQRIEHDSIPEPNTGCWLWLGVVIVDHSGAERGALGITVNGQTKTVVAARYSYEAFIGPIPAGMQVCHKCDTPMCVCPWHFFTGTQFDNMQDMVRKGRQGNGSAKLTEMKVYEIKGMLASGISARQVARQFAMGVNAIYRINDGRSWKHVPWPTV